MNRFASLNILNSHCYSHSNVHLRRLVQTQVRFFPSATTQIQDKIRLQEAQMKKFLFAQDSTFLLIKKYFIYKIMGSNIFINHAYKSMLLAYRLIGKTITNFAINVSAGKIFTAGETVTSLESDLTNLQKRKVGGIPNYVVEGVLNKDEVLFKKVVSDLKNTITMSTKQENMLFEQEGHLAIKFTGLIALNVMERMSKAQEIFQDHILLQGQRLKDHQGTTIKYIQNQFQERLGDQFDQEEFQYFINQLKFNDNQSDKITTLEIYSNGYLYHIYKNKRIPILEKLLKTFHISDQDLQEFDSFCSNIDDICQHASANNCLLYVDAEQTFIQNFIDLTAAQLTEVYNKGDKHIIMNGFQHYLKRMDKTIDYEIQKARKFEYNLGVKMIRGAYMLEERRLAEEKGVESPIFETLEDTHACFNNNLKLLLENVQDNDCIFIASHNIESSLFAQLMMNEKNIHKKNVRFGQLKAFSDQLTYFMAHDNMYVYKYLPFGPTEKVMPYLIRRGQESRQVLREQKFQNEFLKNEIKKRIFFFRK